MACLRGAPAPFYFPSLRCLLPISRWTKLFYEIKPDVGAARFSYLRFHTFSRPGAETKSSWHSRDPSRSRCGHAGMCCGRETMMMSWVTKYSAGYYVQGCGPGKSKHKTLWVSRGFHVLKTMLADGGDLLFDSLLWNGRLVNRKRTGIKQILFAHTHRMSGPKWGSDVLHASGMLTVWSPHPSVGVAVLAPLELDIGSERFLPSVLSGRRLQPKLKLRLLHGGCRHHYWRLVCTYSMFNHSNNLKYNPPKWV